jgi:hypothetical protein
MAAQGEGRIAAAVEEQERLLVALQGLLQRLTKWGASQRPRGGGSARRSSAKMSGISAAP